MCNNISQNKFEIKKKEENVSYEIESRVFFNRPVLAKNIISKQLRVLDGDRIEYIKKHPLKLGDKSRVQEIISKEVDSEHKEYEIVYCLEGESKKKTTSILRFKSDNVEKIEMFLLHAFSVYELRNIDLKYMNK